MGVDGIYSGSLVASVRDVFVSVPLDSVIETLRPLPLRQLGDAPAFVLGVAGIRGTPTPVVDLAVLLGMPECESGVSSRRWITLRLEGRQVALVVDGVVGVRHQAPAAAAELPRLLAGANTAMIAALEQRDEGLLVVLDRERLLPRGLVEELIRGIEEGDA